jgi:DNA helicase-2/ATP-dependent DNA helicase PcrA
MLCPPASTKDTLRFIHEMAPRCSLSLAKAIEQDQEQVTLELAPSPISIRYAEHFKLALDWDKSVKQRRNDPIAPAGNVIHKVLGKGRVVKEEAETFTVEFDDNQRRVFSKRYADQVFESA